jgi:indolepyruvate ferredoxin oxidoreductase, alpha subunit
MFRFGELNVQRIRHLIDLDFRPEPAPPKGRPPQLCVGCPHRAVFETLRDLGCIVSGDIGCYTLGVLPPFEAIDTCVCMGASIGVALGMRHVLPPEQAKKVVSVIGDSTFMHSGLTGLAEMVYNRPDTGHVLLILDNSTTAMTGLQEHPGTGRKLNQEPAYSVVYEEVARAMGIEQVDIIDPTREHERFVGLLKQRLEENKNSVIIARRPCILHLAKVKKG